jgi:hypothetical protein
MRATETGGYGIHGFPVYRTGGSTVPTLSPGDIVIMDNLSSHKVPDRRTGICQTQSLAAGARHERYALWSALAGVVEWFPPDERANYFRNAGYSQSA